MNGQAIAEHPLARISADPAKRSGQACIRDLRITVKDILEYLASDFAERARTEGPPPTVIQIRAGNSSITKLVRLIRENAQQILTVVQYGGPLFEVKAERRLSIQEGVE